MEHRLIFPWDHILHGTFNTQTGTICTMTIIFHIACSHILTIHNIYEMVMGHGYYFRFHVNKIHRIIYQSLYTIN